MGTLAGWASINENGKISGGKAGDQTKKEVKTGSYYDFGQKVVLRFKDRAKAKKYAAFIKAVCQNEHVGYCQTHRMSLSTELSKVGWDVSKLKTDCEVDCSELTRCGLFFVGIIINSNIYTGNMVSKYMATGEFEKLTDKKYLSGGDYNMIGDIAVKESGHTISVLENGAKAKEPDSNVKDDKPQDNKPQDNKPQVKVEYAKSYDKSLSGTYIVNTKSDPLTLRAGAGKSKAKLASMKKGKEVACYGYYTKVDGVKWYYIVCDGVTGFASSEYLKKK